MFKLRLKRKDKGMVIPLKQLDEIIKGELGAYIKRDELHEYLENIERDKKKKELWDSLPARKKIKVLRYVLGKKGELYAKK